MNAGPPPRWLTGNLGEITRLSYAMYYLKHAPKYGKVWKARSSCAATISMLLCAASERAYWTARQTKNAFAVHKRPVQRPASRVGA